MTRTLAAALSLLVLYACGDKDTDTGTDTDTDGGDTDAPADEATFSRVWAEVIDPVCVQCHGTGSGGLFMPDQPTAYDSLVDMPSVGSPDDIRVVPGSADDSYIIHKLEGASDIVGSQMPLSDSVTDEQIQLVRDWIDAGALND
ncbi:MAG: hypothetical protein H0V89_12055 [Deltaproteobacteria bacterium]|nr:hypothetical protein [Deltaproteobacteria bacterium]